MMGLWRTICLPLVGSMLLGAANARVTLADPIDVPRTYMVEFADDYVLHPPEAPRSIAVSPLV